ncbi:MAG: enoyl-CoA hydratase/isomerase family protein [Actinobacteria bacterium]|nr:enoyl-CoA hydratase/isomerase family protein [Actinomycetota bacterium]MSY26451.1 enoyl-CoA hydratase/isomerase family protein [Actinomycetota bacterium]MSZ86090.1 enoyl-CoA hydratase/isomerase family protein [Actinomycetota bacterium]MTB13524.1 enoyl-CoA hydratase/isomerase family protein [Actinomycetota bacterium]MTB24332.1 enoyl-CoA hydratase/isomerase family protein [Actinomycetota bacterium]
MGEIVSTTEKQVCSGYEDYANGDWRIERFPNGVLLVTMSRPESLNAMTYRFHTQLTELFYKVGKDALTKVLVITGEGRAFSSGADLKEARVNPKSPTGVVDIMHEATELVYGIVNLNKPVVSAINGAAVGSGAAVALLADISVAADDAKIIDGHTSNGVVSGDHSVMIWPLLCGMAKAKYLLMLNIPVTGAEAEKMGLVSLSVPKEEVVSKAMEIADRLAASSQQAIRGTKRTLNHWIRAAGPAFEHSLTLEMLDYHSEDLREARAAFQEKREPVWRDGQTS